MIYDSDKKIWLLGSLAPTRRSQRGSIGIMAQRMPLKPQATAGFLVAHFTAANGTNLTSYTSDVGGGWSYSGSGGAASITSNELEFSTNTIAIGNQVWPSAATPPTANYQLSWTLHCVDNTINADTGVVARCIDFNNWYLCVYRQAFQNWQIWSRVTGTRVQIATSAGPQTYANGDTPAAVFSVNGDNLVLKVNGSTLITTTGSGALSDANHPGVIMAGFGGGWRIDDLIGTGL